jgi:hypothetical protein
MDARTLRRFFVAWLGRPEYEMELAAIPPG